MEDFIFLIFIPPVLLCMYYAGFIMLTKLKINQSEKSVRTHIMRLFSGLLVFSVIAGLFLLLKKLAAPAS